MAKRELQEINAGSMADIAFLLLIFFLVTTTMDTDTGLMRMLPPMPDENTQEQTDQINERNIFVVRINKDNDLLVEGEVIDFTMLREKTKEFIANPNDDPNLPEKTYQELPFFGNVYIVKNAVISLKNDRGTTYGAYIAVQNELLAARNELKNQLAMQTFGTAYDDLDEDRRDAVDDYYKAPISEAEPAKIGGQ